MNRLILFLLLSLLLPKTIQAKVCIGNDYEQQMPVPGVVLPTVDIVNAPDALQAGSVLSLNADAKIDERGKAFFVWCVEAGSLDYYPSFPNYSTVKFIPAVSSVGQTIRIGVQVGDSLGYVKTKIITVEVVDHIALHLDKASGNLQLRSSNSTTSILPGTLTLNDQPLQATWTADGIAFNLYQVTGTHTFRQPLKLDLFDAQGQKIYSVCLPFKDVCPATWYAVPIMKLWQENLLQSNDEGLFKPNDRCEQDSSLFCPDMPIKRIEAIIIALSAFPDKFQEDGGEFKQGQQPLELFRDITDLNTEDSPYVYAAQAAGLLHGYPDRTFKPEQFITRAEMAKLICTATYGPEECIATGKDKIVVSEVPEPKPACEPSVTSVEPPVATLNQTTAFRVTGQCLPDTTALWIDQCADLTVLPGGNEQERQFSCTPSYSAGDKQGLVKDRPEGTVLKNFTLTVQAPQPVCSPTVSTVSPTSVMLNQTTTFTVTGQCLPDTTALWIDQCSHVSALSGGTAQSRQFSCTPSYSAGTKSGTVKTQAGGNTLRDFTIDVQAPQPVCSPTVSTVSPTSVMLNQTTTFTVTGQCLPDTTAFWIDQCSNVSALSGGTEQSRKFSCTPNYSSGAKSGLVKDRPNGTVLKSFILTVQEPPPVCTKPSVSTVSPSSARLNQFTTFTVTGQCLPDTTAFWIDQCSNVSALSGGTTQSRQFSCTPSSSKGTKSGVVKDRSGGTVLKDFTVNVQ